MKNLLLLLLLSCSLNTYAQNYLGMAQSNYSGITRFELQPASIADNRLKFDASLFSTNIGFYNNFLNMKASDLREVIFGETDSTFWADNVGKDFNGDSKSVFFNWDIQLPSFMISLNEKTAVAFTSKWRTFVNIDGLEEPLADLIVNDFDVPSLHNQNINNERISLQTMMWAEYGVGYARRVLDKEKHYLKVGGRIKMLQGIQSAYMFADNLQYNVPNADSVDIFNSDIQYGHSDGYEPSDITNFVYELVSKVGIGFDLGIEYEYRPKWQDYKYEMDGRENVWKNYPNKYLIKAGASLLDVGRITFDKGGKSGDFNANISNWNIRELLDDTTFSFQELDDTLFSLFSRSPGDEDIYRMNLPTAINLEVDVNVWKDFYVGANAFMAFKFPNDINKVHALTNYSLIPRWDWRYAGISVPISYSRYAGGFRAGMSVRAGPVYVGTSDIRGLFGSGNLYGGDVFVALKIPIYHKDPKDRDGDSVSDEFDECKDIPGVWAFKGCPDSDNDLIPDTEDECPAEHGLLEFGGCPDSDRDNIPDKKDDCPMVAGLEALNGCPDTDGDGIKDSEDQCPNIAGNKEFNGCPDTDGDGIQDSDDNCPTEAGPSSNFGCPERVRVHLVDPMGNIIATAVIGENGKFVFRNLPLKGTYLFLLDGIDESIKEDLDLIIRNADGDHSIRAILEKSGFFVYRHLEAKENTIALMEEEEVDLSFLKPKEQEILNTAFDNLEYSTAKAIIKESSKPSLRELADLLKTKPTWKISIEGHTDNVGNPANNLMLSKRRADAVKFFLAQQGVETERILVKFFGQAKPIADNDTEEGRQKNRRVEMVVIQN